MRNLPSLVSWLLSPVSKKGSLDACMGQKLMKRLHSLPLSIIMSHSQLLKGILPLAILIKNVYNYTADGGDMVVRWRAKGVL